MFDKKRSYHMSIALLAFLLVSSSGYSKSCSNLFVSEYEDYLSKRFDYTGNMSREKESLVEAFRRNTPEAQMYLRLGFKWEGESLKGPSRADLYWNTKREYDRQKTLEKDRLMPGWAYQKSNSYQMREGPVIFRSFNETVENFTLYMPDTYHPHARLVEGPLFKKAMSERILLVHNTHDIGHLVALLVYPEYRKALIEAFDFHAQSPPSRVRSSRLFYLYEFFTLPDPAKQKSIAQFLAYKEYSEAPTKLEDVVRFFEQMPQEAFDRHVKRLVKNFDGFFLNYGGGQANIPERFYWVQGEPMYEVIQRDYHKRTGEYRKGLSPGEVLHHMNKHLEIFLSYRGKEADHVTRATFGDPEFNPLKLERFIREYVARMEYVLWEGTKLDPVEVVHEMVMNSPQADGPYMRYIETVRGSYSRTYRSFVPR